MRPGLGGINDKYFLLVRPAVKYFHSAAQIFLMIVLNVEAVAEE